MIPITRIDLEDKLAKKLDHRTTQLTTADVATARRVWLSARQEKLGIREHLNRMAPGIQRCMYCGDSLGTDIDHFQPIKVYPVGTFEWPNHLLGCSFCNSNQKRGHFPRDLEGHALLIDPTRDDPATHLRLILRTGDYRALTQQGETTMKIFGLNRRDLARGRAGAFAIAKAALCRAHDLLAQDRHDEASDCMCALTEQPHASVLYEMCRSANLPGAWEVLGADVVAALTDPAVQNLLVYPDGRPATGNALGLATRQPAPSVRNRTGSIPPV